MLARSQSIENHVQAALSEFDETARGLLFGDRDINISLASGIGGYLLYRVCCIQDPEDEKQYDEVSKAIQSYCERVASSRTFSAALYGGTTGVAYALEVCARKFPSRRSNIEGYLQSVDRLLSSYLDSYSSRMHYDLVSGLVGVGVYAAMRAETASDTLLQKVLACLQVRAEVMQQGIAWRTAPLFYGAGSDPRVEPLGNFNLGIAHGVPGVICFLSELATTGRKSHDLARQLRGATDWLLTAKRKREEGRTIYPHVYGYAAPSRLAWCYGDVGIGWALLKAGVALQDANVVEEAKEALLSSVSAIEQHETVRDASICHGAAGICLLLSRANALVPDERFRRGLELWQDRLYDLLALDGNKTETDDFRQKHLSIGALMGFSGIALALHDLKNAAFDQWGRWLLI